MPRRIQNSAPSAALVTLCLFGGISCEREAPKQLIDVIQAGDLAQVQQMIRNEPGLLEEMAVNIVNQGSPGGPNPNRMISIELGRPIHHAIEASQTAIVDWLLEQGVDVNSRGRSEQTPLMLAAQFDREGRTIEALLSRGADVQATDNEGANVLHYAASQACCYTSALVRFIPLIGEIDKADAAGNTALHVAALNGFFEGAAILCGEGANPGLTNGKGQTPEQHAQARDYPKMVRWMADPLGCTMARQVGPKLPDAIREQALTSLANCVTGEASRCNKAGVLFSKQDHGKVDRPLASKLFARGCEGDHALSCQNAALAAAKGWAGSKDPQAAERFDRKACELGSQKSCQRIGGG